jgi:hypothetical protein
MVKPGLLPLGAARPLPPSADIGLGGRSGWFGFVQDAAAPNLQVSEQQNLEQQNRLAREGQVRLDAAVEGAVPNYPRSTMTPVVQLGSVG